ncbi:MAG: ABC transporter ATP-binding protein [Clostridia bacterium]|nr:ABC transporter ATP-binding protein [Clostridia bacterium]
MKRWFKYVKPYLPAFILGPLCMIVEVIGEVIMPRLLAVVINRATEPEKFGQLTVGVSVIIGLLLIGVALVMMAGGVGGAYFGAKASVNFASDLRQDIFDKVQKFSFANIDKFSTGSIVTRLTNDVNQLQNFVNMLLRMALRAPGMMIGGIIMAVLISPSLSVTFAITMPLMIITIVAFIAIGASKFTRMQKSVDALNSTVQENVTNVRVVKSFVREDYETDKFKTANSNLRLAGLSAFKILIFIMPIMNIFMYGTVIAVVWSGHLDVISEATKMSVGDLTNFVTYVTQILSSLMMVSMLFLTASRAMASGKRICEVLDEELDLSDENAKQPEKKVEGGRVEFKNVFFRYYKNNSEWVLENIDFTINSGETVGIIGSTGCGKTTLVSMIPRLYDVDEGSVLVDGVDVKDYSLKNLRDGIGMVLQKNLLFTDTIIENLRWGDADATYEEVVTAAEHAAADKFVSTFKDGYDTPLNKGGSNVSGGQKQRLCIARALLKKPKILILDDSTSAVDTATEAQIRSALKNDLPECTKIIIAQRISSVKDADTIIVMDDGIITGIGTHDVLLENNTEYQEIYYSQMDKTENAVTGGDAK